MNVKKFKEKKERWKKIFMVFIWPKNEILLGLWEIRDIVKDWFGMKWVKQGLLGGNVGFRLEIYVYCIRILVNM